MLIYKVKKFYLNTRERKRERVKKLKKKIYFGILLSSLASQRANDNKANDPD